MELNQFKQKEIFFYNFVQNSYFIDDIQATNSTNKRTNIIYDNNMNLHL